MSPPTRRVRTLDRTRRAFPVVAYSHQSSEKYLDSPNILGTLITVTESLYAHNGLHNPPYGPVGAWTYDGERPADIRRSHQRRTPWRLTED